MDLHDGSDSLTLLVSWRFPLYLYIEAMGYSNVPYLVADKPIKQAVVELGTIAFQISMIFSSFFRYVVWLLYADFVYIKKLFDGII